MEYSDFLRIIYPELFVSDDSCAKKQVKTVTLQVTDDCCMACTYCYQHNKHHNFIDFETAKKFIDFLLDPNNTYVNPIISPGIILDFIGGEPLMAIDLIDQVCDYWTNQLIEKDHPWLLRHKISICSNGLLYFEPKVQAFLEKYKNRLSFSISIDGNKELHDSCRLDLEGKGTYDRAIAAVHHYQEHYNPYVGSKMTLSPDNIMWTFIAVKDLLSQGYQNINLNCIYEEGWTYKHATVLYSELKNLTNYMLLNDLYKTKSLSMFRTHAFCPKNPDDNDNWCGGVGNMMLAIDYKGDLFPCLRYMESSLGSKQEPIIIGNLDHGIYQTDKEKKWREELEGVTRRSQSTDECFDCPIAEGCSWCSAYNYEVYGTVNKRATFICPMHKAACLANAYYWNLVFIKENDPRRFKIYLSDDEALKIISKNELKMLRFLETFPTDFDSAELNNMLQNNPNVDLEDLATIYNKLTN